jgi:hypothetical protein
VQPYIAPPAAESAIQPAKKGAGAGVWIGILGILLLLGGAGLWVYSKNRPAAPVEVAQTPAPAPAPVAAPIPEAIPPNPDFAQPEVIPPNPGFAKKEEAPSQPKPQPARTKPASDSAPPSAPRPVAKTANPTSGTLHAAVDVAQNGEVVFENLPGARLKFTFDHAAWKATISHQPNGTQTLVLRSLKPGIQTTCDAQWEIIQ